MSEGFVQTTNGCDDSITVWVLGKTETIEFSCAADPGHEGKHWSQQHGYFFRWYTPTPVKEVSPA